MKKNAEKLMQLIHDENRNDAVLLALDMLDKNEISIIDLYEQVLAKTLYQIDCQEGDKECIWKEHIETAIVRTITEVIYPHIIKQMKNVQPKNKRIIVLCPVEEYHEIGAKMAHDFFLLQGYDSIFIGANTPKEVAMDAVRFLDPDYIAISVTNMYNVINAKRIVESVKTIKPTIKVLAGGVAFHNEHALETVGADKYLTTFESIKELES